MSDERDGWADFVREVQDIANAPEHGYRALLLVGLRVTDGVVRINSGASPPMLRQTDGSPLTPAQLEKWRDVMLAAASDAIDRVMTAMTCASAARASGTLQ